MCDSSTIIYFVKRNGKVIKTCKTLHGARSAAKALYDNGKVLPYDLIEIYDNNHLKYNL